MIKQILMLINPPSFFKGGISIFFAELVRKRASPFEKGGLRGIFKIHNIMIINALFLNLMAVTLCVDRPVKSLVYLNVFLALMLYL